MPSVRISASILGADFTRLGEELRAAQDAGCDEVHLDVMDGRFVPNISIGLPVLEAIRPVTSLPVDVHMMVEEPARFAAHIAKAGGDIFTVHLEACADPHAALAAARDAGMKAGIAINPATPSNAVVPFIAEADRVLVMSVEPGWGGQPFLPASLEKVREIRRTIDAMGLGCEVAIDGGIKKDTAGLAAVAGAQTLVSGTGIFRHPDGVRAGVRALRASAAH